MSIGRPPPACSGGFIHRDILQSSLRQDIAGGIAEISADTEHDGLLPNMVMLIPYATPLLPRCFQLNTPAATTYPKKVIDDIELSLRFLDSRREEMGTVYSTALKQSHRSAMINITASCCGVRGDT